MVLNSELIEDGKALVQKLDEDGVKIEAAFWFYFSDISAWKLVLSMPEIIHEGPKAAYREVQKPLTKLSLKSALSLDDISVLKPDAPLLKLMRFAIRTGPGISGIRFANNIINGQRIEDSYIYRL